MIIPLVIGLTFWATGILAATPVFALEDWEKAISRRANSAVVCKPTSDTQNPERCDPEVFAALANKLDIAFALALSRAQPTTQALLIRDQVWAKDMIESFDGILDASGADESVAGRSIEMFKHRIADLEVIKANLGRPGIVGSWINAFGRIDIASPMNGVYRIIVKTESLYGMADQHAHTCVAEAHVSASDSGWLSGDVKLEGEHQAPVDTSSPPAKLKVIRQGETLRVATNGGDTDTTEVRAFGCSHQNQLTGTYFPASPAGSADEPPVASEFIAPTFNCARPWTPTEEEICADPELASGDQALNRAWSSVLSKLDDNLRTTIEADQRAYVRTQAHQFEKFLHPSWEKASEQEHFTANAREAVRRIQRERIAFLEGLDPARVGIEGLWYSADAILNVTRSKDGAFLVKGGRWDEMDYRRRCEFDAVVLSDGIPAKQRKEDGASQDEAAGFKLQRRGALLNIEASPASEQPCTRGLTPVLRLFPVRSSPDISPEFIFLR